MYRLFRLIFCLMAVAVVIIFAERFVGGKISASPLAAVFSSPEGLACQSPCMFGIQPGVTTIHDATLILQSHPVTRNAQWLSDRQLKLAATEDYVAFSETVSGLVDSVSLTATPTDVEAGPAFGSLLSSIVLGDYIVTNIVSEVDLPEVNYVVVLYPDAGTYAFTVKPNDFWGRVKVNLPLAGLIVSVIEPCPTPSSYVTGGRWAGFTRIQHYRDQAKRNPVRSSGLSHPPVAICQDNR
jgi:hypothetical protein